MSSIKAKIFNNYKYTPLPFIALMFLFKAPNIWSLIIGLLITSLGEIIRLWGSGYAEVHIQPDTFKSQNSYPILAAGPFAHSRNPLYFGNILLYFGLSLMSFALFPFLQIFVALFFYLQYSYLIKKEEANVSNVDEDYFRSVPALLPRISAFSNEQKGGIGPKNVAFSLHNGLLHESLNIKAFVFLSVTLILIWFIGRF
ncbi:MAG: methyltransferase family protein [Clostridiales bacterium]